MKSIYDIWPTHEVETEFDGEALWEEITKHYPQKDLMGWAKESAPNVWQGHETAGLQDIVEVAIISGIAVGWVLRREAEQ